MERHCRVDDAQGLHENPTTEMPVVKREKTSRGINKGFRWNAGLDTRSVVLCNIIEELMRTKKNARRIGLLHGSRGSVMKNDGNFLGCLR